MGRERAVVEGRVHSSHVAILYYSACHKRIRLLGVHSVHRV
jgi:hypothetical protein